MGKKEIPEISYSNDKITPIIDSQNSFYTLPYYKDVNYFSNYESYINFIKGVERMVRSDDRYRKYIKYLKEEVRLDRCQVLKNVTDQDADIEMHHGPIFTLFDICAIVLEYFIIKKWKISTVRVANTVLEEHKKNRVQVVMVSKTVHEQIHNGEIFINYHQAFGDLNAFLKKYADAIGNEYREQLNLDIEKSLIRDSNDFGVLEFNKNLVQ